MYVVVKEEGLGCVMPRHEAGEKGLNHKEPFIPS